MLQMQRKREFILHIAVFIVMLYISILQRKLQSSHYLSTGIVLVKV